MAVGTPSRIWDSLRISRPWLLPPPNRRIQFPAHRHFGIRKVADVSRNNCYVVVDRRRRKQAIYGGQGLALHFCDGGEQTPAIGDGCVNRQNPS
jgi:hypothetical protein